MATWKIEASHTEINFKTRHLLISTVSGHFSKFEGTVEANSSDFTDAQINFSADIDSITTKDERRDGHLKSPDFFDAANHPKLLFVSKSLTKNAVGEYELTGDLTIRGITKEVKLNVSFNGSAKTFGGTEVAAFEITGSINRFDFGLQWNALTEVGGIALGEQVKIEANVELNKVVAETLQAA